MKTNYYFIAFAFAVFTFTSCSSSRYFQVYKATPGEGLSEERNALVYEDENCKILYDLWADGGNIGFQFYNKTDQPIFLNMEESFFIKNHVAHDYYRDRVITHSFSAGNAAAATATASVNITGVNSYNLLQTNGASRGNSIMSNVSAGEAVAFQEEKVVQIPAMASKIIAEYEISEAILRNCDLFLYPKKRQVETLRYDENSTPIAFSNRLSYSLGEDGDPVNVEHNFFVSEITNYPEKELMVKEYEEFCGEKSRVQTSYFKEAGPDMFYISYDKKPNSMFKH